MLTKLKLKALVVGTFVYLASVMLVSGLLSLIANTAPGIFDTSVFRAVYWIGGVLMLSAGGFISGFMAASHGIFHGVLVAIAGAVGATLLLAVLIPEAVDQDTIVGYLSVGVVLSGLAGGNGELLARKHQHDSS